MLNLKVKMCVKCNLKEAYKKDKYPSYCADCKKGFRDGKRESKAII